MTKIKYTIDASNRAIGRVATEAASILIGKNLTTFAKNVAPNVEVTIANCSKAKISEKKKTDTIYRTYTGFRGGLYDERLDEIITKKGYGEAFKRAVNGMLPKNKLRKIMINNLKVTE
ncbi:MAG: 50S ribosomal protein L13 [Candidatus Taylorbacteria bacterium]|nr:50S ribosomal protein L13 [Candidatus Taylorbacteria bacterium]